jgi:hypothetical protein
VPRERIEHAVSTTTDINEAPHEEPSRREFLRRLAAAGAGAAGLTLLSQEEVSAAASVEYLLGNYTLNHDFSINALTIESQSRSNFVGRFDDGTGFAGTVTGSAPGAITLVFTRLMSDGSIQIYFGAAATRPAGTSKEVLLTGTLYHNGTGPLPWVATGTLRR